jgi:hypothetical protein
MSEQFEIVFEPGGVVVVADLLEDVAPITCENFREAIAAPVNERLSHGKETGPEMWCYVPEPREDLPYENATVFPEHGDILYYHYRTPPTREGKMVYDIGMYWDRGQSKLRQGWIPGNLFAQVRGKEQIAVLRKQASRLLAGEDVRVTLRKRAEE